MYISKSGKSQLRLRIVDVRRGGGSADTRGHYRSGSLDKECVAALLRAPSSQLGCGAVLGAPNHEYYRGCFREDRAALLAAGDRTVTGAGYRAAV